ncbi:hypothetical protein CGLAMM_08210 [Acetobacteraceae bacterium EV16G]|uniref:Uncharacterized protein n=1 Tax=Sorlinia euscelidii TaxID=3081148 RepID=A0ABU7U024_9PROT
MFKNLRPLVIMRLVGALQGRGSSSSVFALSLIPLEEREFGQTHGAFPG